MKDKKKLIEGEIGHIKHSFSKEDLEKYGRDWTVFYSVNPLVILFPKDTKEVQEIILFANKYKIPIVPSGGRTGLSGGAVASNLEMVVSLEKMNKINSFNAVNQSVSVEAGITTEEIQNFAINKGLFYPVDFASKGSSQIGGNIATNAGGIKVLKHGLTRNFVSGLTFVTAKGEVLTLNKGLIKNATGFDLRHLVIGSEGTLGIITEATIQLVKISENLNVLLLGVSKISNILQLLIVLKKKLSLTAFEFFSNNCLEYNLNSNDKKHPFLEKSPYYVLVEFENSSEEEVTKLEKILTEFYEKGLVENDMIAQNSADIHKIWQYREGITESIAKYTPYKNDISVLPSLIPEFIAKAEEVLLIEYKDFEICWFGHIGDGNIHINILKPKDMNGNEFYAKCNKVSRILFSLVKEFKGSISAEHGIGLLKKEYNSFFKTKEEIEYFKGIKQLFDPNNIMNPGKVIDL